MFDEEKVVIHLILLRSSFDSFNSFTCVVVPCGLKKSTEASLTGHEGQLRLDRD